MTVIQRIQGQGQGQGQGCGCDEIESARKLITIDAALKILAKNAPAIEETEVIPLSDALGRVLALPIQAQKMLPLFDNAAMDGYAIRTSDLVGAGPWQLKVSDRIPAGRSGAPLIAGCRAAQIFTGAPIPPGADAVVMQEHVVRSNDVVTLHAKPDAAENIRFAGEEIAQDQIVLEAGRVLGARQIAACAAAGSVALTVRRRLRVALLMTGDEVRPVGQDLGFAGIWDVNTPMLQASISSSAVELIAVQFGTDDLLMLRNQLSELARKADIVVTTGGLSVGEEDHVRSALRELGANILFSGVAIKPGKPVSFGHLGQSYWLGLPGNPLASFITWNLFGKALLRGLSGQSYKNTTRRRAALGHELTHLPGRCELRLADLTGHDEFGRDVISCENASHSARVIPLANADGIVIVPADKLHLPRGAILEFQPFSDD
jgi:molybdopterin molybdotransferase